MSKYDDIINLEHYELKYHTKMSMESRAAQFAPFAALTGYSEEIKEVSRLTDDRIDMFDDYKLIIDRKLQEIKEHINERLKVSVIYFIKDNKKKGGKYIEYIGVVRRIDLVNKIIVFIDGKKINIKDILDINIKKGN